MNENASKLSIPRRFQSADYDRDVPKEFKTLIEYLVKGEILPASCGREKVGIYLVGPTGVGKTYYAYAIAKKFPNVRIWNYSDLLQALRDEIQNSDDYSSLVNELSSHPGLVVLDDIGSTSVTDWGHEKLMIIINTRYEEMLPTMIIGNLKMSELSNLVGPRIISRIAGLCATVEVDGKDMRIGDGKRTS